MPGIVTEDQAAAAQQPTETAQQSTETTQQSTETAQQPSKARKQTKNEFRRAKKKAEKRDGPTTVPARPTGNQPTPNQPVKPVVPLADDPVQDVPDVDLSQLDPDNPLYAQFSDVFAKFQNGSNGTEPLEAAADAKPEVFFDEDNVQDEEEEEETKQKLSKKARKEKDKLSVAELKAMVAKPEVVDWTDVTSIDPKLLVNIKATRNVVPVPTHWQLKREYLSSKRGVEKQNFRLPPFIAETGIAEMRDATATNDQTLKQQQRAKVNPSLNKLDIDYQKLFEAFFRRQTKPHLTRFGEIYYEGKEFETDMRHLRPGEISDSLREALNMPPNAPMPWLINQQKVGCPPSYPAMKIPGVNAPLPPGGKWGFEPLQYGKPPVKDEQSMAPLWGGDLFGTEALKKAEERKKRRPDPPVSRALWGELQSLQQEDAEDAEAGGEEEEEEEEEEEGAQEEGAAVEIGKEQDISGNGLQTPFGGAATPSGMQTGMKSTAEVFNLRKNRRPGNETEEPGHPRAAGQVVQERSIRAEGFFGGERSYDLKGAHLSVLGSEVEERGKKRKAGDLDVSVDVDALERGDGLSKDEVRKRYDETRQRERVGQWKGKVDQDDLSNMIAEENAKRLKRNQDSKRGR